MGNVGLNALDPLQWSQPLFTGEKTVMRKLIINSLINLAGRRVIFSTILNRLWCIYWTLKFKNVYADKALSYDGFEIDLNRKPKRLNDDATNYMTRVLLEREYSRIVEIGAYDLQRAFHYKRLFPNLEVVALDKISGFDAGKVKGTEDIQTDLFSPEWFKTNIGPKTLVTACGTLSYFKSDELKKFFQVLKDNGYDLALVELGSHFAKEKSLRRSVISYYHPYVKLLADSGFSVDCLPHPNHAFSLGGMERREYILASSAASE